MFDGLSTSAIYTAISIQKGLCSSRQKDMWHVTCHMALCESRRKKTLTSPQIRAARALIRWTAEDLSRQSAVSLRTIRRAELAERDTSMTAANDLAIRRALEAAGVEFIDENGGGPGVRLKKRTRPKY
jgi:hypothetical protein